MYKFQMPAGLEINRVNQRCIEDLRQRINQGYFAAAVSALSPQDHEAEHGNIVVPPDGVLAVGNDYVDC